MRRALIVLAAVVALPASAWAQNVETGFLDRTLDHRVALQPSSLGSLSLDWAEARHGMAAVLI